jgi:hypothetical protein
MLGEERYGYQILQESVNGGMLKESAKQWHAISLRS